MRANGRTWGKSLKTSGIQWYTSLCVQLARCARLCYTPAEFRCFENLQRLSTPPAADDTSASRPGPENRKGGRVRTSFDLIRHRRALCDRRFRDCDGKQIAGQTGIQTSPTLAAALDDSSRSARADRIAVLYARDQGKAMEALAAKMGLEPAHVQRPGRDGLQAPPVRAAAAAEAAARHDCRSQGRSDRRRDQRQGADQGTVRQAGQDAQGARRQDCQDQCDRR